MTLLSFLRQFVTNLRRRFLLLRLSLAGKPITLGSAYIKLELADHHDEQMISYILNCDYWYASDKAVFREHIKPGDVVIDIGANVGFVSVILARLVGVEGRVVAIEPCRTTYTQLLRTIVLNGPLAISPMNIGCGASTDRVEMYSISESSGHNTMRPPSVATAQRHELIAVETLDSIVRHLNLSKINLIKIDVEGYEPEVLQGAMHTLMAYRPKVYFEVSDKYREQSCDACKILRSLGYVIMITDEELKMIQGVRNVLARPPDSFDILRD